MICVQSLDTLYSALGEVYLFYKTASFLETNSALLKP